MNLDEITKIIGSTESPIALGGYDSDDLTPIVVYRI